MFNHTVPVYKDQLYIRGIAPYGGGIYIYTGVTYTYRWCNGHFGLIFHMDNDAVLGFVQLLEVLADLLDLRHWDELEMTNHTK